MPIALKELLSAKLIEVKMKNLCVQAIRFVGVSGLGWVLDFIIYVSFGQFSSNLFLNNIISSWSGVTLVFMFATRKIFQNNNKTALKYKYILYLLYQCILIFMISKLLNIIYLTIINNFSETIVLRFSAICAKILVTPITMVLNFFAMKYVIEKI